jgi:hypothetical protein
MDALPVKISKKERKPKKTGVYLWLHSGRISPSVRGYKRLKRYLRDMEKGLFEMQGAPDKVTPAKEILIKATIEAYGVLLLASIFCREHGVVRPDRLSEGVVELQPVMGHQFLAFMNTCRQNLITLGMDSHKTDEILDLGKYIELKDNERSKPADKAPGSCKCKAQEAGPEIACPESTSCEIPGKDDAGDDIGGNS